MKTKKKIAILGAGSFAIALAHVFFSLFRRISLWEYKADRALLMDKERRSRRHLPDVTLPVNVSVCSDIAEVIHGADLIFIAVPSDTVEATVQKMKRSITPNQTVVICSKGFASKERLLSDAIQKILPKNPILCLSGPNLAREMIKGEITGAVLAGKNASMVKPLIETETFLIETSEDIIGAQIGGALKNVVTMLLGIAEGAGFLQNTRAYLFTKGLKEIKKIGCELGALPDTFSDLSCLGDLMLLSRNRELGIRLGKGERLASILKGLDYIPEGLKTLESAYIFAKHHKLDVPVIDCLYVIVIKKMNARQAILKLIESLSK